MELRAHVRDLQHDHQAQHMLCAVAICHRADSQNLALHDRRKYIYLEHRLLLCIHFPMHSSVFLLDEKSRKY